MELIEFPADDSERALRFWRGLLAVELDPRESGEGSGWQTHGEGPALGIHERGRGPGDRFALPYFAVDDLPAALKSVTELGGEVIHPGESWAGVPRQRGHAVRAHRTRRLAMRVGPVALPAALIVLFAASPGSAEAATSRLVYACGPNLCEIQPDGRSRRALTRDGTWQQPYRFPSRSRSGTRMAFSGRDAYVHVADGRARQRRRLVHTGRPRIHSGGEYVLDVTFHGDAYTVCRVRIAGGKHPCATGDGFWSWGTGLDLMTADPGADLEDSRMRMYEVTTERVRTVKTIAPRRADHDFDGIPSVSPDGRLVAVPESVPERGTRIALYSMRSGKHVRDVTKGPGDGEPSWSPDGRQLVFLRGAERRLDLYGWPEIGRIMRVGRDGGKAREIVRSARDPYWGS